MEKWRKGILTEGREAKECGWGLGCVVINGNANRKVSWTRFGRALNAKLGVCTSRNSVVPEGVGAGE